MDSTEILENGTVQLFVRARGTTDKGHSATGFRVAPKLILTASHLFNEADSPPRLEVRRVKGKRFDITGRVRVHRNDDADIDLALVELVGDLDLTEHSFAPVPDHLWVATETPAARPSLVARGFPGAFIYKDGEGETRDEVHQPAGKWEVGSGQERGLIHFALDEPFPGPPVKWKGFSGSPVFWGRRFLGTVIEVLENRLMVVRPRQVGIEHPIWKLLEPVFTPLVDCARRRSKVEALVAASSERLRRDLYQRAEATNADFARLYVFLQTCSIQSLLELGEQLRADHPDEKQRVDEMIGWFVRSVPEVLHHVRAALEAREPGTILRLSSSFPAMVELAVAGALDVRPQLQKRKGLLFGKNHLAVPPTLVLDAEGREGVRAEQMTRAQENGYDLCQIIERVGRERVDVDTYFNTQEKMNIFIDGMLQNRRGELLRRDEVPDNVILRDDDPHSPPPKQLDKLADNLTRALSQLIVARQTESRSDFIRENALHMQLARYFAVGE